MILSELLAFVTAKLPGVDDPDGPCKTRIARSIYAAGYGDAAMREAVERVERGDWEIDGYAKEPAVEPQAVGL